MSQIGLSGLSQPTTKLSVWCLMKDEVSTGLWNAKNIYHVKALRGNTFATADYAMNSACTHVSWEQTACCTVQWGRLASVIDVHQALTVYMGMRVSAK